MRAFLGFNKAESIAVTAILLILGMVVYSNLAVAQRRSRDSQRKSDIRTIHDGLVKYQNDFGHFPASLDGKIVACGTEKDNDGLPILIPCEWGWDSLRDVADPAYPAYITKLPSDPNHGQGKRYYYISNQKRFQIYTALESAEEAEYNTSVIARNLPCGNQDCNAGLAFSTTPIERSIENYEEELREKEKNK